MNKRQARLWAQDATRTRAEHEDMLMNEWGFAPPAAWTDPRVRQEVLNRIRDSRWRWRSTWTPPGWTPPPGGVVQNWPLAVLATAAGLAILLGVAIGAMWLASDPFDDDGTPAQPTVQPTAAPSTGTPPPATATAATTPTPGNGGAANNLSKGKAPIYDAAKFRHPNQFVQCTKTFDPVAEALDWILCEPGVLLSNTATFTRGQIDAVYNANCPEGGFFYASMGEGTILMPNGVGINLNPTGEGINHLVLVRCPLSDGKRDTDLNATLRIGNFVVGHTIWSEIPPNHPDGSAYVSMEWFGEQLITSFTTGGSNCGSNGCTNTYVHLYDVDSGSYQKFLVTNITGESGNDFDGDGIVDYASANWSLVSSNR